MSRALASTPKCFDEKVSDGRGIQVAQWLEPRMMTIMMVKVMVTMMMMLMILSKMIGPTFRRESASQSWHLPRSTRQSPATRHQTVDQAVTHAAGTDTGNHCAVTQRHKPMALARATTLSVANSNSGSPAPRPRHDKSIRRALASANAG